MIWIINDQCLIIIEHRYCFLKGNTMLTLIDFVLVFIPFKMQE